MSTVSEHYENFLADHYSWLFGGVDAKTEENRRFFESQGITSDNTGTALDLGAGSGFQSIPLAQLGFKVTAIDLSPKLLAELAASKDGLDIEIVQDDFLKYLPQSEKKAELCVCMGDTLTHLKSREEVHELCQSVFDALENNGKFVLTFRDLMHELRDLDRFIPFTSDANKIFTCFLEYESEHVKVHDLIYEKNKNNWNLKKSFYRKCRIPFEWIKETLIKAGFSIHLATIEKGLITMIALK